MVVGDGVKGALPVTTKTHSHLTPISRASHSHLTRISLASRSHLARISLVYFGGNFFSIISAKILAESRFLQRADFYGIFHF